MSISVNIKKRLQGFTLDVQFAHTGSRLGILGASGCGKSMTLRCIAGIEDPDEGRIAINDTIVFDSSIKKNIKPQQRNVGYLFQNYALFPNMNVEKNIGIGIREKKKRADIVADMIRKFRLEGLEKRMPSQLSGGQQQRVALARIMAYEPDVIMLDEPFSAMDSYLRDVLQQQLLETLEDYTGDVILVTHNRDEVYKICDTTMVMDQGGSEVLADTMELFANPKYCNAAKLTGCKNISPIRRVDAYHVEALDWQVTLETKEEVKEDIRYVGIRAHDFIPHWESGVKNGIAYRQKTVARLPFETHYYATAGVDQICWFVQLDEQEALSEKGMPIELEFPKEKLLLLR